MENGTSASSAVAANGQRREVAVSGGKISMGKGAWDVDANCAIPPEKEAIVFEEIATMDFPFEGIPTIPPRKDLAHFSIFFKGKRYRMKADPTWTADAVKEKLGRAVNLKKEDLILVYAGDYMDGDNPLSKYDVPPGCGVMLALKREDVERGTPDKNSAYWN